MVQELSSKDESVKVCHLSVVLRFVLLLCLLALPVPHLIHLIVAVVIINDINDCGSVCTSCYSFADAGTSRCMFCCHEPDGYAGRIKRTWMLRCWFDDKRITGVFPIKLAGHFRTKDLIPTRAREYSFMVGG